MAFKLQRRFKTKRGTWEWRDVSEVYETEAEVREPMPSMPRGHKPRRIAETDEKPSAMRKGRFWTSLIPRLMLGVSVLIITALGFSVKVVHAQEKTTPQIIESWECFDRGDHGALGLGIFKTALVKLKRMKKWVSYEYGVIEMAGSSRKTSFHMSGINRYWGFSSYGYSYAFVIEPNGYGLYYDFGKKKRAKASQYYKCVKSLGSIDTHESEEKDRE